MKDDILAALGGQVVLALGGEDIVKEAHQLWDKFKADYGLSFLSPEQASPSSFFVNTYRQDVHVVVGRNRLIEAFHQHIPKGQRT
jgi:hypothetical protein